MTTTIKLTLTIKQSAGTKKIETVEYEVEEKMKFKQTLRFALQQLVEKLPNQIAELHLKD